MKTPHKHAELIKAWADGAEIEFNDFSGRWAVNRDPSWSPDLKYRIKPDPKPDFVIYVCAAPYSGPATRHSNDNLKLAFDGLTGKLKAAEVIQ